MARKFTAEEMREIADELGLVNDEYHRKASAMLIQYADLMEREKRERRRKKKYEYSVKYISGCGLHCKLSCNTLDEAYSFVRNSIASRKRIYRREIGEWEEVEKR